MTLLNSRRRVKPSCGLFPSIPIPRCLRSAMKSIKLLRSIKRCEWNALVKKVWRGIFRCIAPCPHLCKAPIGLCRLILSVTPWPSVTNLSCVDPLSVLTEVISRYLLYFQEKARMASRLRRTSGALHYSTGSSRPVGEFGALAESSSSNLGLRM